MRLIVEETVGQVTEVEILTTILQIADFDAGLRMMLEAEQSQTTQASGDITLTDSSKTIQFIDPNGANRIVNLPSTSVNNHGFVIVNSGSSYTLTVKSGSTTLGTVQAGGGIGWFLSNGTEWIKAGGGSSTVSIQEVDGSPAVTVGTIKVPNGTLADNGGGIVQLTGIGVYPYGCEQFWDTLTSSGAVGESYQMTTSQRYNYYYEAGGSSSNDQSTYTFPDVILESGTYTLTLLGRRDTGNAIIDVYFDGVEVGSMDWYRSSNLLNAELSISFSVSTGGRHSLYFKVDGKNASAGANYYVRITKHWLTRTGA